MKRNAVRMLLLLLLFAGVLLPVLAADDEEQQLYRLKMERIRLQQQISKFKKERRQLKQDISSYRSTHRNGLQSLQKQVQDAEQQLRAERGRSAAVLAGLKRQQYLLAQRRGLLNRFMTRNRVLISAYNKTAAAAVPLLAGKESAALDGLQSESRLDGVTALEIYNRLWTVLRSGLMSSFDSQSSGDDKSRTARLLRLGRVLQYRSDGVKSSVLAPAGNAKWKKLRQPLSDSDRLALRRAVQMVDGKKPPDFVTLPVPVKLVEVKRGQK